MVLRHSSRSLAVVAAISVALLIALLVVLSSCTQVQDETVAPTPADCIDNCTQSLSPEETVYGRISDTLTRSNLDFGYYVRPALESTATASDASNQTDTAVRYPGIVIVHEWWGLNDNIRHMADLLASQGYAVVAVDLYNGHVATTADDARELVGNYSRADGIDTMRDAVNFLRAEGSPKVGILGWCFGGGEALQLSMSGERLDATAIYYGTLVTNDSLNAIQWPVLGVFGSRDTTIQPMTVDEFRKALDTRGIENHIYMYDGVGHAFANPSNPGFAKNETADAWQKTLTFFSQTLGANSSFDPSSDSAARYRRQG